MREAAALFVAALTLAAIDGSAAPVKCTDLHEAVLYQTGGTLLIDQLTISGGAADWTKVDPGLNLASTDCVAVKEPLVIPQDVRRIVVVNSDSRRFVLTTSLHPPRAEDVADRDSIFATPLPDLSVGQVAQLGGTTCGPGLKPEERVERVYCAEEALKNLSKWMSEAQTTAWKIENGLEVAPRTFEIPKELTDLSDYTLLRSDIDEIATNYSAYPRDVVAPIAENTSRAIALTPVIVDGIRRLNAAIRTEDKLLQADVKDLYPGATLFVVVHRTLPANRPSFSRVFYVERPPVPPPSPSPQAPPQPSSSTIIINEGCCEGKKHCEDARILVAPALLYIPGAHDDSFGAKFVALSGVALEVQRTATRDTSLQPGIMFGVRIGASRLSADLTFVPSSPVNAFALGVSRTIVNPLRVGAGIAFARQTRLSGISLGDFVATPDDVTTSDSYRPHPYVSISVDVRALCCRR